MHPLFFDLLLKGGPMMGLILAASVLAVAICMERLLFFHRNTSQLDPFLNSIRNLIQEKRFTEAIERCDDAYGPAVKITQVALVKRHLPKNELREMLQEVAQLQVPRLEANLPALATLGYICPLLGLLGTVTGMITIFMAIDHANGSVPVGDLSKGIWEALITTAGGLAVAIPCHVAHNYFVTKVRGIIVEMERAAIEIVHLLKETDDSKPVIKP
jgi:biopolymer transport protein ExbB